MKTLSLKHHLLANIATALSNMNMQSFIPNDKTINIVPSVENYTAY